MAPGRNTPKVGRPQPPSRRSARLRPRTISKDANTKPKDANTEPKHLPSSPTNTPGREFPESENRKQKRKRSQEDEPPIPSCATPSQEDEPPLLSCATPSQKDEPPLPSCATPSQKRLRTSSSQSLIEDTIDENVAVGDSEEEINPLEYWRRELRWPKEYFEPESNMLAKKRSSLRGKLLEAGSVTPSSGTPSDQKPREAKSTPYMRAIYETILATKGSFMDEFNEQIEKASRDFCHTLLNSEQTYPFNSLFRDDLFHTTCRQIRNRSESMVIRDISQLITPSAQTLATYGATHLDLLVESVNEGWNSAEPFYGPRPQPDYSVGFGQSAFTNSQLEKLEPYIGELEVRDTYTSYFMGTWRMFFPFLTCEVKCGARALDVADRQNAHSMTLAVRGVVELFRLVKRETELHRQILAFSISHDDQMVRIYGHYPVIEGDKTTFYRHPITVFGFMNQEGKDKWTAYKFTKNVYDMWMPAHFKRICSAIDKLM